MNKARSCGLGLPLRAFITAREKSTMMKRMILAGLLVATAVPVLASDASYDINAATSRQSATASTTSKTDGTSKHNCSCQMKHHM